MLTHGGKADMKLKGENVGGPLKVRGGLGDIRKESYQRRPKYPSINHVLPGKIGGRRISIREKEGVNCFVP